MAKSKIGQSALKLSPAQISAICGIRKEAKRLFRKINKAMSDEPIVKRLSSEKFIDKLVTYMESDEKKYAKITLWHRREIKMEIENTGPTIEKLTKIMGNQAL